MGKQSGQFIGAPPQRGFLEKLLGAVQGQDLLSGLNHNIQQGHADALAQQAYQQQMIQNMNNADVFYGATGKRLSPNAPIDMEHLSSYVDPIRQNNQNPNREAYMNGDGFHQNQFGTFDQGMAEKDLAQRAAQANYQEYLNQQARMFQNGQMGAGGQPPQQPPQQPGFITGNPIGASLQNQMMNPQQPSQMVTGGTSMQAQAPPTSNPFFGGGVVGAADLNSLFNKGVDNTETRTTQAETQRHNQADEGNDAYRNQTGRMIYEATKAGQGGYANSQPAPYQPSEATRAYQAYQDGLITRDEYARTLGAVPGGKNSTEDPEIKQLQTNISNAVKVYGKNSDQAKQALSEYQNRIAGEAFKRLPSPQINMSLPFLGQSKQNLNNSSSGKYGLKY